LQIDKTISGGEKDGHAAGVKLACPRSSLVDLVRVRFNASEENRSG